MARTPFMPSEDPFAGLDLRGALRPRSATAPLWDEWRLAQVEAELALFAWRDAPAGEQTHAHRVYAAALDREERAARALARQLTRAAAAGSSR
jgi:hypothetical protein